MKHVSFVFAPSGSGKTHFLKNYASKYPSLNLIDGDKVISAAGTWNDDKRWWDGLTAAQEILLMLGSFLPLLMDALEYKRGTVIFFAPPPMVVKLMWNLFEPISCIYVPDRESLEGWLGKREDNGYQPNHLEVRTYKYWVDCYKLAKEADRHAISYYGIDKMLSAYNKHIRDTRCAPPFSVLQMLRIASSKLVFRLTLNIAKDGIDYIEKDEINTRRKQILEAMNKVERAKSEQQKKESEEKVEQPKWDWDKFEAINDQIKRESEAAWDWSNYDGAPSELMTPGRSRVDFITKPLSEEQRDNINFVTRLKELVGSDNIHVQGDDAIVIVQDENILKDLLDELD